MARERIFWGGWGGCGGGRGGVGKANLGHVEICCNGDDEEVTIMLSKDMALKLAQSIIDCYE